MHPYPLYPEVLFAWGGGVYVIPLLTPSPRLWKKTILEKEEKIYLPAKFFF